LQGKYGQECIGKVSSSEICRRVVRRVSTDISEEHIASIFRVEEISSAKTSKQAGGKQLDGLHDVISQKIILFITTSV
jgi:hypothetical protein